MNVTGHQNVGAVSGRAHYFDLTMALNFRDNATVTLLPWHSHWKPMDLAPCSWCKGTRRPEIIALMSKMKAMTARPLASLSGEWRSLPRHGQYCANQTGECGPVSKWSKFRPRQVPWCKAWKWKEATP